MEDDVVLITMVNIDKEYVGKEVDTGVSASVEKVRNSVLAMSIGKKKVT